MSDEAFLGAIKAGDLQEIKRLHQGGHLENECPWDAWACRAAAEGGQLECLKYLHENGCPWDQWACRAAALRGHLECLKYLHENGCPWNAWTCRAAAECGQLECLQYLHENGCPWDERACAAAAEGLELECLQYLHENGCPWNIDQILNRLPNDNDINESGVSARRDIQAYLKACMESPNKCPYQTAMAVLDGIKEGITDGDYKTIADALMYAHREERRRE